MKRLILALVVLFYGCDVCFAVMTTYTWVGGGVNTNWATVANWDSGGVGIKPAAIPRSTDSVSFTASSPSCVIAANASCYSFNNVGYTNHILFDKTLSVGGNVTLSESGAFYSGADTLKIVAAATLTSNGRTVQNLKIGNSGLGSATFILADNWNVTNLTIAGSPAAIRTIIGVTDTFEVTGNLSVKGITTGSVIGSAVVSLNGTGNVDFSFKPVGATPTLGFCLNWTINTAEMIKLVDTLRVGGGNVAAGDSLTYIAGTIVPGTSNFKVVSGSYVIRANAAGLIFNTLTLNAPTTFNGTDGWTAAELISSIAEGAATSGDLINYSGFTGWTKIRTTLGVTDSTFICAGGGYGYVYLSPLWIIGRRYRVCIAGTTTASIALRVYDVSSVYYGTLINGSGAFTFTTDTTVVGSATFGFQVSNGAAGETTTISAFTLYEIPTHTFASGKEYIVTDSLKLQGMSALQPVVLKASTPSSVAYLTLNPGCRQSVSFVEATDISSINGIPVYDFNGVLVNSPNWISRKQVTGQSFIGAWGVTVNKGFGE